MPELPEVDTVCRSVARRVTGKTILSVVVRRARAVSPLTTRQFSRRLRGMRIESLRRRAKYLVFELIPETRGERAVLLIHLRMTGDLYVKPDGAVRMKRILPPFRSQEKQEEVSKTVSLIFSLHDGSRVVLDDPRGLAVCQLLGAAEADAKLARLGVEPLSAGFTAAKLFALTRGSRAVVKLFLMDQSRIAGLGNIYAAEALFRAGIDPQTPAGELTANQTRRLRGAIVGVLRDAVQSALRGYRRPGGFGENETFEPQVYGREGLPCLLCGSVVRRILQGSRSTYYCPECQPRLSRTEKRRADPSLRSG